MSSRPPPSPRSTRWGLIVVWGIVVITCLPEIILQLSEQNILGQPIWRVLAYQNGAFWPGLLDSWRPNYPAQPVTMFLSYSGLHVSLPHLLGNMLALIFLAQILAPVTLAGGLRFAGVYLGSALGAAVAFALLYSGSGSMVGASGAIFGMAGAAIIWRWRQRRLAEPRRANLEAGGYALGLVVLNAASHLFQDGPVAWEAHMGGAITGGLLALVVASPGEGLGGREDRRSQESGSE